MEREDRDEADRADEADDEARFREHDEGERLAGQRDERW